MALPLPLQGIRRIYETAFDSHPGPPENRPGAAVSSKTKLKEEDMAELATLLQQTSIESPQMSKKPSSISLLKRCRKWRTPYHHSVNLPSKSSPTSPVVEAYCCSPARQRSSNSTTATPCLSLTRLWNSADLNPSDEEDGEEDIVVEGQVQSTVDFPIPIQNLASSPRKFRVHEPLSEWGTSSESVSSVEASNTSSIVSSRESLRSLSSSLSSQSSDFGFACAPKKKFGLGLAKNYCQVLSPISDKSAETNSPKDYLPSPAGNHTGAMALAIEGMTILRHKEAEDEDQHTGSDSGISIHSHDTTIEDLPFYMPKLRRNRAHFTNVNNDSFRPPEPSMGRANLSLPLVLNTTKSKPKLPTLNSLPSKDLHITLTSSNNRPSLPEQLKEVQTDPENETLPFFMPKLHRKSRGNNQQQPLPGVGGMRLALRPPLIPPAHPTLQEIVNANLPLEDQGWYHGAIPRTEAEIRLRHSSEGSFLVRSAPKLEYYLSAKTSRGFIHVRISHLPNRREFRLHVESSNDVSQSTIPSLINQWAQIGIPLPDATCLYLRCPVIEQLL